MNSHPTAADAAARYFPLLIAGDAAGLRALFSGAPRVDDVLRGAVQGEEELTAFAAGTHGWLAQRRARVEPVCTTVTGRRAVHEAVLHLDVPNAPEGPAVPLPVAVVAETAGAGPAERAGAGDTNGTDQAAAIRIYHSTWPLSGHHAVRAPLLTSRHSLRLPEGDPVARYQQALADGDLDEMLRVFEPDGYAREPSGGPYVYRGSGGIREFYTDLFSAGGGVPLEHCTLTDDGVRCAIEYNVVRWGHVAMVPQAGVAVYERGAGGLLAAARIYDDVSPPTEAAGE